MKDPSRGIFSAIPPLCVKIWLKVDLNSSKGRHGFDDQGRLSVCRYEDYGSLGRGRVRHHGRMRDGFGPARARH